MKKINALLLTFSLVSTLCLTTACGRYGKLFFQKDVSNQKSKVQADKTIYNNEQDDIIIQ